MPARTTSAALVEIKSIDDLCTCDLVIFRSRLYRVAELYTTNPDNLCIQLKVVRGSRDDTVTGWRNINTLVNEGALKLVIH